MPQQQNPLTWNVPIADQRGLPTPEFMRKWSLQVQINSAITDLSTAAEVSGVLDKLGTVQGDLLYRAVTAWTVLPPGTNGYLLKTGGVGANPSWASISTILDSIGAAQGDILYRDTASWQVLAPGTAGYLLKTGGAGANPSWVSSSANLDSIGAVQGDLLYRDAAAWNVLAPGTAGYLLKTGGAAANPSWNSLTSILDAVGSTQGDILYRDVATWQVLAPHAGNAYLRTGGGGNNPAWVTASGILTDIGLQQGDTLYHDASAWQALHGDTAGKFLQTQGTAANPVWAYPSTASLSDVSSGTWTPVLQFGGASVGITYSAQIGSYLAIGKMVFVSINVTLTSKGTSTGSATITGLPFASFSSGFPEFFFPYSPTGNFVGVTFPLAGFLSPSSTSIGLVHNYGGTSLNDTNLTNTSAFAGAFVYRAN